MAREGVGTVYLVGAGPGDPGLLTLRGAELLRLAGAVAFDALVNPELLRLVPPGAECLPVGRRAGVGSRSQESVNRLLVELAHRHEVVVRLKGGDPFVFGRGGEEALALQDAGVPFQVVPGITAALGAAASAGIPLTHRGVASRVTFLTGHRATDGHLSAPASLPEGRSSPTDPETVVIYMGLGRLDGIVEELVREGRSRATPAAVIERGTLPDERVLIDTLGTIAPRARAAKLRGPALIVVGEVVTVLRRDAAAKVSHALIRWAPSLPPGREGRSNAVPVAGGVS